MNEQPEYPVQPMPPAGPAPSASELPATTPLPQPSVEASRTAGTAAGDGGSGSERPELPVGAAFAGGFVLALILKRLAR